MPIRRKKLRAGGLGGEERGGDVSEGLVVGSFREWDVWFEVFFSSLRIDLLYSGWQGEGKRGGKENIK